MWQTLKLSDVCSINNGGTPNSKEKTYWGDEVEWLTPKDMGKLKGRKVSKTERQITKKGLANSSAKLVPENSVIISCRAPIGHVAINDVPMSFNQGCKGLIPNEKIIAEFLYYFLVLSKNLLNELGTGTTFKEISAKTLSNVPINVPPINEQQRIVDKLDAAFSELDETLSLTQSKIDELEKLITSCLKELGNINDAEEFTINTLCKELYAGGDAPSKDKRSLTRTDRFKIPIFSNGSENAGLYGYCEEARTVEPAITISARGTIGHIELRHEPFLPIVRLIVAIPNTDIVQIKFLKYALLGSKIFSSGSSIPQLTVPMLRELPLRIPNLPTQKEIMSKLDMIFELREKFQSIQNKKLVQLSALKSAFLAQELQSEAA